MAVRVKRIVHNNSYYEPSTERRWGVYVNGELVENFTNRQVAEQAAEALRNTLRAEKLSVR